MHFSAEAVGLVPALALGYAVFARAARVDRAHVVCAAASLVLVFAAFASELQPLALHTFLWAHLLQNVVLAEWAPALLVLAIPPSLGRRAARFALFRPVVALPVWLVTYFVWHLPWIYDAALEHPSTLLHLEHVAYFVTGLLLWWCVFQDAPHRLGAGTRAAYVFAAFVLGSPIGLVMALVPEPIYDFYADGPGLWGLSPITDQEIAGVTMAVEQSIVFFAAFAYFFARFFAEQDAA